MIKLEDLISVMSDDTKIVLLEFGGNQPTLFNGTVEEFKQTRYGTYKDNKVAYIEPFGFVSMIYIIG